MSNRQARIARKKAQREGTEVFAHVKPTKRRLLPLIGNGRPVAGENPPGSGTRATRRRERLYGENTL